MRYLGVDYHKSHSTITAIEECGRIRSEKVWNDAKSLTSCIERLTEGEEAKAVLEAGRNWGIMYDFLESLPGITEVLLSNSFKTKAIASAKIKTDTIDSRTLAYLLKADLIPKIHVPPKEKRQQKEIIRFRTFLVALRTKVKNRIHVIIDRNHVTPPPLTDLFGKGGMEFLLSVELTSSERKLLDMHLELLDFLKQKIKIVEKWSREIFKQDKKVALLTSIPGIGNIFASLISLEIDNIDRFPGYEKLWSYAGLVPSTYASGQKVYYGRLIKHWNKWLRWAFIEAAHSSTKSSYYFQNYYQRLKVRKDAPTAIVATARKLAKVVYWVLKEKRSYIEIMKPWSPSQNYILKGSGQE